MSFRSYLSSTLLFLAITTTIFSTNVRAHAGISQLCKQTDYPALCKSVVKLAAHGGAKDATQSAIHATILQTKQAMSMIDKLMKSQDALGRANLKVCKEVYDDAISNLVTAMKNLKDKSDADLKINLSAVISDFCTCDDGFTETPGVTSPLGKVSTLLQQLASNSLALATEVKN